MNSTDPLNSDERLNLILDKISKYGMSKLDKDEYSYLDSYSLGKEEEINKKLYEKEFEKTFSSDDGNFTFRLKSITIDGDTKYINGTIYVPDLLIGPKKRIKGELKGSIMVFDDKSVALDFNRGKYDIFEFVSGLEYELDNFVDDIVIKLIKKEN